MPIWPIEIRYNTIFDKISGFRYGIDISLEISMVNANMFRTTVTTCICWILTLTISMKMLVTLTESMCNDDAVVQQI